MRQLFEKGFKFFVAVLAVQSSLAVNTKIKPESSDDKNSILNSHADFLNQFMEEGKVEFTYHRSAQEESHIGKKVVGKGKTNLFEKDPALKKLVYETGVFYQENDYLQAGVSKEQYLKVWREIVIKIRQNMVYAINTEVLRKLLSQQPKLQILILPKALMKNVEGAYDPTRNIIYIAWNPHLTDTHLRSILRNEFNHASICAEMRPQVGSNLDCLLHPEPEKVNKALEQGYRKIDTYRENFFRYLEEKAINKDKQPSKNLQKFFAALACYEPENLQKVLTLKDHQEVLKKPDVKHRQEGQLYVPKGTLIAGVPVQEEFLATVHQIDDKTVSYTFNWAIDDSVEAKAKAFFIDLAQFNAKYNTNYGQFFNTGPAQQTAEKLSSYEHLPTELKRFFFKEVTELLSNFHHVKNYADRPCPLTLS